MLVSRRCRVVVRRQSKADRDVAWHQYAERQLRGRAVYALGVQGPEFEQLVSS
jgi:hypothetical protein